MNLTKEDAQLIFGAMLMSMGPSIIKHIPDEQIADAPDDTPTIAQYRSLMTKLNDFLTGKMVPTNATSLILSADA